MQGNLVHQHLQTVYKTDVWCSGGPLAFLRRASRAWMRDIPQWNREARLVGAGDTLSVKSYKTLPIWKGYHRQLWMDKLCQHKNNSICFYFSVLDLPPPAGWSPGTRHLQCTSTRCPGGVALHFVHSLIVTSIRINTRKGGYHLSINIQLQYSWSRQWTDTWWMK